MKVRILCDFFRKIKKLLSCSSSERGQSIAEFTLILPIIMLLVMLPIDYARLMYTKMLLNTAATEALAQLEQGDLGGGVGGRVINIIDVSYGDRLDVGRVSIESLSVGSLEKQDYIYYVYSSERALEDFEDQFDARPSNYSSGIVKMKLAMDVQPITFLGKQVLGSSVKIQSREYAREIYAQGYTP
ncbi:MAG: pilus assembly protein [Johnsonella sp.]|nr:pilus assembly protein [Johnsonella sp.]